MHEAINVTIKFENHQKFALDWNKSFRFVLQCIFYDIHHLETIPWIAKQQSLQIKHSLYPTPHKHYYWRHLIRVWFIKPQFLVNFTYGWTKTKIQQLPVGREFCFLTRLIWGRRKWSDVLFSVRVSRTWRDTFQNRRQNVIAKIIDVAFYIL